MQTLTTFLALVLLGAPAACSNGGAASSGGEDAPQASPASDTAKQVSQPRGTPQPKLPVGTVVLETPPRAPITVKAEIASTDTQRQMGLMWRTALAEDEGMLFLFEQEQHLSFWMRNTLISLDLIFIGSDWKVVGVAERATPLTDDPRDVPGVSQYVLEVAAGWADRHGIVPGTEVRFTPPGQPPVLDAGCAEGDKP
jgi:uncharacterized protein